MASTSSDFPPRSISPHSHDDLRHMLSTAFSIVEQTPPPSLREILTAYRNKGDGDRDMLLAMLNAKAAEDQRIASVASLQRTLLDAYQSPQQAQTSSYHQPTPPFTQSPHLCDRKSRHQYHHHPHHMPGRSRSPHHTHHHHGAHHTDPYHSSRKRHRPSHSPPPSHIYEMRPGSQHDHLPPSPYSSSGRSDSAEFSPHSRSTMAIGSLLSSGPRTEGPRDDV